MDQASNEIRSTLFTSIKSPIETLNLTKSFDVPVTTDKISTYEQVAATDIHTVHDIDSLLGYGDLSDAVTQTMLCAIAVGSMLLIVIWYLFIRQIPFILRHTPTKYLARTLILCGIYSIVGSAALVSLIAYRAFVFCDSVCHFAFLLCAYQYFALVIEYAGGESNFIKNTSGILCFNVRTPPFCCCLRFLLPSPITKDKFKFLRLMVLQMPIVQGLLLALLNVLNSIDTTLYEQVQPFITIFIVASILSGVWSLQINSRMIAAHLPEHKIMHKYFAIQLVLILYKLQPLLIHTFCYGVEMLAGYRINSKVIENAVIQLIILLETTILSYFANQIRSMLTYLEGARFKLQSALLELDHKPRGSHPLAPHIQITRDRTGLQQSILKVPLWLKNSDEEKPNTESEAINGNEDDAAATVDGKNEVLIKNFDRNFSRSKSSVEYPVAITAGTASTIIVDSRNLESIDFDRGIADGGSNQHDSDFDEFSSQDEDDEISGRNSVQGTNRRSTPNPSTPKVISRCRAIYAYSPKLPDELEINPGDLIDVHIKQEDGWWVGAIKERVGTFPATYVEEIV